MFSEQAFHDKQADQRSATFRADPAALLVSDDAYLDHESWIGPAFARLGDVVGLDVLDYGCGHGMAAVVLARRGGSSAPGPAGNRLSFFLIFFSFFLDRVGWRYIVRCCWGAGLAMPNPY